MHDGDMDDVVDGYNYGVLSVSKLLWECAYVSVQCAYASVQCAYASVQCAYASVQCAINVHMPMCNVYNNVSACVRV